MASYGKSLNFCQPSIIGSERRVHVWSQVSVWQPFLKSYFPSIFSSTYISNMNKEYGITPHQDNQHQWISSNWRQNEKQTRSSKSLLVWRRRPSTVSGRPQCSTLFASHPLSRQLVTKRPLMLLSCGKHCSGPPPKGQLSVVAISGALWPLVVPAWAASLKWATSTSGKEVPANEVSGAMVQAESE